MKSLVEAEKKKVLNPTLVKLGLVSLFADISSEMLYPITPIFLTTVLGASMTSVGFIEGVAEGLASLLKTYSAVWSDRISKRKPFIFLGYFLSAIAKPLMGFATVWPHIIFARGMDRMGKGIRGAPRDALLAEAADDKHRGAAFGWHRAMDTLGAAIGPLIAILYLNYYSDNLRPIYYWSLIPGLIAVLFIFIVKEKANLKSNLQKNPKLNLSWSGLPSDFKKYVLSWGIFSLANSSDVFLLLKAKQEGVSLTVVILMYCFYNLFYALLSPYFGRLSDKVPRVKILISGLLIFSFVYLGFSVAKSLWQFWILFAIYGIYMAATDGVGKALAIDLIEKKNPELKATGIGVLGTITGLATIIASTVAGFVWDSAGPLWTFVYGASGALLCVLFLLIFVLHKKNYNQLA